MPQDVGYAHFMLEIRFKVLCLKHCPSLPIFHMFDIIVNFLRGYTWLVVNFKDLGLSFLFVFVMHCCHNIPSAHDLSLFNFMCDVIFILFV